MNTDFKKWIIINKNPYYKKPALLLYESVKFHEEESRFEYQTVYEKHIEEFMESRVT